MFKRKILAIVTLIVSIMIMNCFVVYADYDSPVGPIDDPEPYTAHTLYFSGNIVAPNQFGLTNGTVYSTYGTSVTTYVYLSKSILFGAGAYGPSAALLAYNTGKSGGGSVMISSAGYYFGCMQNLSSDYVTLTGGSAYFLVN